MPTMSQDAPRDAGERSGIAITDLLAGGIAAARFDGYRNYSYSMMGAGWALVFFTAYAAHGLPEARIIESAVAGAVL